MLLPLPLSPTSAVIVPGPQREGDVVDRVHAAAPAEQPVAGGEVLRQAAHLERGGIDVRHRALLHEMARDEVAGARLRAAAAARSSAACTARSARSLQCGQRGWKRQPAGGDARSGGEPGNPGHPLERPGQRRERADQAERVRVPRRTCAARSAGACSTISPAYMIAIRCANSNSSERSCVMKSTAKPSSRCRSRDLLQDLALHDDVERRRRLVHDHELRVERERHRDDHALAHAAGELVRVRAQRGARRCRRGRAARPARASAAALRDVLVRAHHVDELVADAHHRVERVHRALEDHRDVPPAVAAQLLGAEPRQVVAAEEDAAAGDARGRPQDLHDRVRDGASCRSRTRRRGRGSRPAPIVRSMPSTATTSP